MPRGACSVIRICVLVAEHPHLGVAMLLDANAQIARQTGAAVGDDAIWGALDDE
jgi:hypothetical protein